MKRIFFLAFAILFAINTFSQEKKDLKKKSDEGYKFTTVKRLKATSVKNQYRSGTCWSFSGISFIESELLRTGKGEYDLSEMFIVRNAYSDKATKYVRLHGNLNFGSGGAFHDVTNMIKKYGIVPNEVYTGLNYGEDKHVHGELDEVLLSIVKAVVSNKNHKLTTVWHDGFDKCLDTYLGEVPKKFTYKGKEYTPKSFAKSLGLNMDDYIEVTSFTHHPFNTKFILEIPDNWEWQEVYNVSLDDMMKIIDNSINTGYTVGWASDVSEKGFSWTNGVAIVPKADIKDMTDEERSKWSSLSKREQEKRLYKFDKPGKEKVITQEMRQKEFDNYKTTDDHGMHITGIAKDQNGNPYYIVKNSWSTKGNDYKGYFYASKPFVALKTTAIMINKNSLPKDIAKKLGL